MKEQKLTKEASGEMSTVEGLILLVPDKPDIERDALCREWSSLGGSVLKLAKFWRPPDLEKNRIRIYGPDTFGLVLADIYGLTLIEPAQKVALDLPERFLRREMKGDTLAAALKWRFPLFVKPFAPKAFTARVYLCAEDLAKETKGMAMDEEVLGSEIVALHAEARAFVLGGKVLDCALYEGEANVKDAFQCAREIAKLQVFPRAFVLDLALLSSGQWVFLEANAAWGAGLNGCDAAEVLPAIEAATRIC